MQIRMLKAKIHRAQVTGADIDYEGSILIDESLLEMSGILPHEEVQVWNVTNANRFTTYAIPAPPRSGEIIVNGAAAHLVKEGDKVIITSFCDLSPEEAKSHQPTVVLVGKKNLGQLKANNDT